MRLIDADALHKSFEEVYNHPVSMFRDSAWWFFGKLEDTPTITLPPNDPLPLEELREIVKQLEWCGYKCEGGPLNMNKAFIRLKELACRRKPEEEAQIDGRE